MRRPRCSDARDDELERSGYLVAVRSCVVAGWAWNAVRPQAAVSAAQRLKLSCVAGCCTGGPRRLGDRAAQPPCRQDDRGRPAEAARAGSGASGQRAAGMLYDDSFSALLNRLPEFPNYPLQHCVLLNILFSGYSAWSVVLV